MGPFLFSSGQLLLRSICVLTVLLMIGDGVVARPAIDFEDYRLSLLPGSPSLRSSGHGATYRKKRNMDSLIRIIKRSSGSGISEDTINAYTMFYNNLKDFIVALKPKLTPVIRDSIDVVTEIITPDYDFSTNNVDDTLLKIRLTSDLTELILKNGKKFIKDIYHVWFDEQKNTLNFLKLTLQLNLVLQNFEDSNGGSFDEVSSGLAGINTGVGIHTDLPLVRRILELKAALESDP